ncbi:dermokine isoform 16 [Daubentonia madagascariensis]|uniref:Dermokine isoform 16 n=1 Tax=Daubentonia madagascariensis TaxID=31869 RepID=A0ABD2D6Y3_DAUMA
MLRLTSLSHQLAKGREGMEGSNTGSSPGSSSGSGGGNKPENSETSSGPFNFDTFWKNFKSKLGFINWDAINKDQRSSRIP